MIWGSAFAQTPIQYKDSIFQTSPGPITLTVCDPLCNPIVSGSWTVTHGGGFIAGTNKLATVINLLPGDTTVIAYSGKDSRGMNVNDTVSLGVAALPVVVKPIPIDSAGIIAAYVKLHPCPICQTCPPVKTCPPVVVCPIITQRTFVSLTRDTNGNYLAHYSDGSTSAWVPKGPFMLQ